MQWCFSIAVSRTIYSYYTPVRALIHWELMSVMTILSLLKDRPLLNSQSKWWVCRRKWNNDNRSFFSNIVITSSNTNMCLLNWHRMWQGTWFEWKIWLMVNIMHTPGQLWPTNNDSSPGPWWQTIPSSLASLTYIWFHYPWTHTCYGSCQSYMFTTLLLLNLKKGTWSYVTLLHQY